VSNSLLGCICVNGHFSEPQEATISALDAGFLLGDGLFESLRASEGVPYLLDRHLTRLFSAAAEFEFANMPCRETVTEQVYRTLQRAELADAYVRVTISRGSGSMGLAPQTGPPTVVIAALPAPLRICANDGIEAALLQMQRGSAAKAKSTSWQQAVLARRRVAQLGASEGIYVSADGLVLEGVASNVFVVENDRLLTPRVSECLPGITRARLIELARGVGMTALEAPLDVATLMTADEVFVTNAVQGLRLVCAVDGIAVGAQARDSVFVRLHGLYEEDHGVVVEVGR
jgi:branched-subunit amino acid aminotransferase/4-amino-4-deoxychorismate lyase